MKSIAKSLSFFIILSMLFVMTTSIVSFAGPPSIPSAPSGGGGGGGGGSTAFQPNDIMNTNAYVSNDAETGIKKIVGGVFKFLQLAGSIIAIAILVIFGIKWFFATAQTRAQLKEQMWGYIIGALLVFGATTLMGWLAGMFKDIIK